jgi:hypothetical protein
MCVRALTFENVWQGKPIAHVLDVMSVAVNRWGPSMQRKCVLQDRNRDIYIVPVAQPLQGGKEPAPFKLGTMCTSAIWHEFSKVKFHSGFT